MIGEHFKQIGQWMNDVKNVTTCQKNNDDLMYQYYNVVPNVDQFGFGVLEKCAVQHRYRAKDSSLQDTQASKLFAAVETYDEKLLQNSTRDVVHSYLKISEGIVENFVFKQ